MKRVLTVILLSIMVFLSACYEKKEQNMGGETGQLHNYDSPYTICYKNDDNTYSMYIYAAPIQYKTEDGYALIDNTIIKSDKDDYAFENKASNVKTYFPKTLSGIFRVEKGVDYLEFKPDWNVNGFSEAAQSDFINMYGDKVSAVIYESSNMSLTFYSTRAGIKVEILLKEKPKSNRFVFKVIANSSIFENKQNGYISLKNGDKNKSVIYHPLVQYTTETGQQLDLNTQMYINNEEEGDYNVTVVIDESIIGNIETQYPIKFDPSFEMYINKMPDSTIYSNSNVNSYLCHYAVTGEHPILGEGWHYMRLRVNYFMEASYNDVNRAFFHIRGFNKSNKEVFLSLNRVKDQWSSTQMTWSNRMEYEDEISRVKSDRGNVYSFDITNFVKECLDDTAMITESCGLLLKTSEKNSYKIFATSDNSLNPPFIEIIFNKLPSEFTPQENINP